MEYRALGNSNLDDGTVKGDRREAACMAWFPAGRELYPVSVKFKGDDGEVICVRNINISSSEDILCNGIASKQFLCNAVIGGLVQDFALIFYAGRPGGRSYSAQGSRGAEARFYQDFSQSIHEIHEK